jgi:hypothetical protein
VEDTVDMNPDSSHITTTLQFMSIKESTPDFTPQSVATNFMNVDGWLGLKSGKISD